MLRRRPDDTFELRLIERAIVSVRPAGLSPERREALRLRIMSSLEEQDAKSRLLALGAPDRWIAVPTGVGIAAMIFAAVKTADVNFGETSNYAARSEPVSRPYVAVPEWPAFEENNLVTTQEHGWIRLGPNATIGIEQGTTVSYSRDGASGSLFLEEGRVTAASLDAGLVLRGAGWSATLAPESTAYVQSFGRVTLIHAYEGRVMVINAQGDRFALLPGASHVMVEPEGARSLDSAPVPAELAPPFTPATSLAAPSTGPAILQDPGQGSVLPGAARSTAPAASAVGNAAPPPPAPEYTQPATGPGPAVNPVEPASGPAGLPPAVTLPPTEATPPPFAPAADPPAPPPPATADHAGQGAGSNQPTGGSGNSNAGVGPGESANGQSGGNANPGSNNAGSNGNANNDAKNDSGANGIGNGNANGKSDDSSNGNGSANGNSAGPSNGNGNANAIGKSEDGPNGNGNAKGNSGEGSGGNSTESSKPPKLK